MSRKVAIIGAAGTLGSCAAFTISYGGIADELILLPHRRENLVKLYQYDLQMSLTGINNTVVRVGQKEDLADADVVLICAGAPWRQITTPMEWLEDSIPVVQEVAATMRQYCPNAVLISQTNPIDPIAWLLVRWSGFPRERVLGYSLNDSLRFKRMMAEYLNFPPDAVDGMVVGEHGKHQVPLFSSVRVNGKPFPVEQRVREMFLEEVPKIVPRMEKLGQGRMAGWTCSTGAAALIRAILNDTGETFACAVMLQGEYGRKDLCATVPVRLGRGGVQGFPTVEMEAGEREKLEACFDFLEPIERGLEQRFFAARAAGAGA